MALGNWCPYAGSKAPKGWLLCNGDPIPPEYKDLISLLGSNVTPDLQGYFLRGLDATQKIDPGVDDKPRSLLQKQEDSVGSHVHTYEKSVHKTAGKSGADNFDLPGDYSKDNTGWPIQVARKLDLKNYAVNYIIQAVELDVGH